MEIREDYLSSRVFYSKKFESTSIPVNPAISETCGCKLSA